MIRTIICALKVLLTDLVFGAKDIHWYCSFVVNGKATEDIKSQFFSLLHVFTETYRSKQISGQMPCLYEGREVWQRGLV